MPAPVPLRAPVLPFEQGRRSTCPARREGCGAQGGSRPTAKGPRQQGTACSGSEASLAKTAKQPTAGGTSSGLDPSQSQAPALGAPR